MTYNVFSGTLNPTQSTTQHMAQLDLLTLTVIQHIGLTTIMYLFNGRFPYEPHLASSPPFSSSNSSGTEPLGISVAQVFMGRMSFLSPNQQCQSTEGNTKH